MEINQWLYKSMYKLLHSYAVNYLAKKKNTKVYMCAKEVFWLLNRLSQLLIKTLFSTYNATYIFKVFA